MEVPGDDVGVMLHHAQHDLIARADVREAKARGDEIDRLRRRSRENDLLVRTGVDEPPHGLPGRLIRLGRRIREIVQAPMHIRIFVLIGVSQAIDHLLRLLGRGGVIQIDKRLPIGSLGEDREIRAHRFNIIGAERRLHELVHVFAFRVPEPGRQSGAQGLDQRLVLDSIDRFPSKSLEQHRPRVAHRDAARLQIKDLFGIQRSDRRSVSAYDVVGENLQLRLLVHLRPRRQENSLGLHRPIGLLRRVLDDDLSLKHADCIVVDDRAIEFAAHPAGRGMNDLKRRIGEARAVDERKPSKRCLGPLSAHPDKNLPSRQLAAGNQSEGAKLCGLGEFADLGFDVQPGLVADHRHMRRPRPFGQGQNCRCVTLDADMSAFEELDERGLRSGVERDVRPGIDRVGRSLVGKMHERDRLGDFCVARDRDCASGRAQRRVEIRQGIVDRGGDRPLRNGDPGRETVRKLRDKASAKQDESRPRHEALTPGKPAPRGFDVGAALAPAGSARRRPSRRASRCSARPRRAGWAIRPPRIAQKRRRAPARARVFPVPRIAGRASFRRPMD